MDAETVVELSKNKKAVGSEVDAGGKVQFGRYQADVSAPASDILDGIQAAYESYRDPGKRSNWTVVNPQYLKEFADMAKALDANVALGVLPDSTIPVLIAFVREGRVIADGLLMPMRVAVPGVSDRPPMGFADDAKARQEKYEAWFAEQRKSLMAAVMDGEGTAPA